MLRSIVFGGVPSVWNPVALFRYESDKHVFSELKRRIPS